MVRIEIKTSNAAYRNEDGTLNVYEVCRNLAEISDKIKRNHVGGTIMDYNGNKVGSWSVE